MTAILFPVSRIAVALGKSKKTVQQALSGVAAGSSIVRGQQSNGYTIEQLPVRFRRELETIVERRGYRGVEHLLSDAPARFLPRDRDGKPVPISEIATNDVSRAMRLRAVIAPFIAQSQDQAGVAFAASLQHYRREFGQVTERHLRRIWKRTVQRDAGECRFDDLALYCDEVVARKAGPGLRPAGSPADQTLLQYLADVKNPSAPDRAELALIWAASCEHISDAVAEGENLKRAYRKVIKLFAGSPVVLSRTDGALKKLLKRKYDRWLENGQTIVALEDQRPNRSGWHRSMGLTEADRNKLVGHARINCGGRLAQAFRELRAAGELDPSLIRNHIENPRSKSYVPATIRRAIAPDVERLKARHRGPREHKLRGAHHTRDWSRVAAGDWFQSDDLTPPVYFLKASDQGKVELTRGQFLPMIDEATTYILGFVLIQQASYNSISIRSLITTVCSEHGLPRRGFAFERGIWKSSRLIAGDRNADLDQIADTGLRRLGMRLRHALLPRAKVIERTLGQLQDLMESLPGYCGRNEMLEKYEAFRRMKLGVEAGRLDPSFHFLDGAGAQEAFAKICDEYNRAPQDGRKLAGLSPQQAWEGRQGSEPRAKFFPATHYFLASDVRKLKVGRNGLTFRIGKQPFNYKGIETGKRVGKEVYTWFNPQRPETLACTADLNGNGLFLVERSESLDAVAASREAFATENALVAAHNSYAADLYHVVKNSLPAACFRGQIMDRSGLRLGQAIETQQKEISDRRKSEQSLDREIRRKATKAGISAALVPRSHALLESLDELAQDRAEMERRLQEETT